MPVWMLIARQQGMVAPEIDKALAAGLTSIRWRSPRKTRSRGTRPSGSRAAGAGRGAHAGISAAREAEVLKAWKESEIVVIDHRTARESSRRRAPRCRAR
jgi:hypothetical protein